jgi:hypothetical protein
LGDLGHYIADGHMPLHTSDNHDGQNTNQKGILGVCQSCLQRITSLTFLKVFKRESYLGFNFDTQFSRAITCN